MWNLKVPKIPENDATKVDHPEHGALHFTACATDSCLIHFRAKEGAFFLRKVRPEYCWRHQEDVIKVPKALNMATKETVQQMTLEEIPETDEDSEGAKDSGSDSEEEEDPFEDPIDLRLRRDEQDAWARIMKCQKDLEVAEEMHEAIQRQIAKCGGNAAKLIHP